MARADASTAGHDRRQRGGPTATIPGGRAGATPRPVGPAAGGASGRSTSQTGSLRLADRAVAADEQQEPVERRGRTTGRASPRPRCPSKAASPSSSASALPTSRLSVGSSSSSRVAPGELEQQHLEAGLLAAGERREASGRPGRAAVARQRRHRPPAVDARDAVGVAVAVPEQVDAACGPATPGGRGSGRTARARRGRRARPRRCARRRSPASSRSRWLLPAPLAPSSATRSPKKTSRSNGRISPVSCELLDVTAGTPVRPPRSRIVTFWSSGGLGRRPGRLEPLQPRPHGPGSGWPCRGLILACSRRVWTRSTQALVLVLPAPRAARPAARGGPCRASRVVAKPPPWTQRRRRPRR